MILGFVTVLDQTKVLDCKLWKRAATDLRIHKINRKLKTEKTRRSRTFFFSFVEKPFEGRKKAERNAREGGGGGRNKKECAQKKTYFILVNFLLGTRGK
jgi:hypothetical protein